MTLLLDTQVVLWLADDAADRVPANVIERVSDSACVLLSAVVWWEIAIKVSLGKLKIRRDLRDHVAAFGLVPLPITDAHAWSVGALPPHHRDPFDRLLVAQATVEGATLVTADAVMARYDVPVLWG